MEQIIPFIIPALLAVVLVRTLLLPMKLLAKVGIHSLFGFVCLWLLNLTAPFTGLALPVNGITVLTAGFLGLPGIALMAILEVL